MCTAHILLRLYSIIVTNNPYLVTLDSLSILTQLGLYPIQSITHEKKTFGKFILQVRHSKTPFTLHTKSTSGPV